MALLVLNTWLALKRSRKFSHHPCAAEFVYVKLDWIRDNWENALVAIRIWLVFESPWDSMKSK